MYPAYGGAEVLPDRTRIAGSNPMPCRRHRIAFYNIYFPVLGQDKPACNGQSGLVCFMFMLMYKWGWPLSAALPVAAVMLAVYDIVVMARMELGRHNWRQIILGTIVGGVPQVLAFALLYQGGGRF